MELISLLLWFAMLYLLHRSATIFKHKTIFGYFFIILMVYFIMRLGVISTVHSFIRGANVTISTYLIFFFGVIIVLILLTLYIYHMSNIIHLFPFKVPYFFQICTTLLLAVFIILITNGLVNHQISNVIALDILYQVIVLILLS